MRLGIASSVRLGKLRKRLRTNPGDLLQEGEPLLTRSLSILMKSTRLTGHMHLNLQTVLSNYLPRSHGAEMALSQDQEEIWERIWAVGIEAGFDRDGYRRVLEQVFK